MKSPKVGEGEGAPKEMEEAPEIPHANTSVGIAGKAVWGINKVCIFNMMDTVEDRCRVRVLNVWAFLLVYVFFVLALLKTALPHRQTVDSITFVARPPAEFVAGFVPSSRKVKGHLKNTDGSPKVDVHVHAVITSLISNGPMPCGTRKRFLLKGTLEAMRTEKVCSHSVVIGDGKTDKNGLAALENFTIDGPVGTYTLRLQSDVDGRNTTSETSYSSVTTSAVAKMSVIHPSTLRPLLAPYKIQIGTPLSPQPALMLLDAEGRPVVGQRVVVFDNPSPTWPPDSTTEPVPAYYRYGQRYAKLECDVSELSDAQGIARFTCLRVVAATFKLNFVFAQQAAVFVPWNDKLYSFDHQYNVMPNHYKYSTAIISPVKQVEFVQDPPSEIMENSTFEVKVRLKDSSGQSVQGHHCFAVIHTAFGDEKLVFKFRRQLKGYMQKELLNAFSSVSDSDGIATFPNLKFSPYGNVESTNPKAPDHIRNQFLIQIVCDEIESEEKPVKVKPKTHRIIIKRFIETDRFMAVYKSAEASDGSDTFLAVVRVVDENGRGVLGKTLEVENNAGLITVPVEAAQEPTSRAGFAVVPFRVVTMGSGATESQTFNVMFNVDGKMSDFSTTLLTARLRGTPDQSICQFMYMTTVVARDWGQDWATTPEADLLQYQLDAVNPPLWSGSTFFMIGYFFSYAIDKFVTLTSNTSFTLAPESAYSTDAQQVCWVEEDVEECDRAVKFEPELHEIKFPATIPGIDPPSVDSVNNNGGAMMAPMQILGPPGTHWFRVKTTLRETGRPTQTCYSPPVAINVKNVFNEITIQEVTQRKPAAFTQAEGLVVSLKFILEDDVADSWMDSPSNPAAPNLNADQYADSALSIAWVEVPRLWSTLWSTEGELSDNIMDITESQAFTVNKADRTAELKVRFHWKLPGMFGSFAVMFKSMGVHSEVYEFTVTPPENLALEVIREPAIGNVAQFNTQTTLPQVPIIKVTSNGQPLNGAIVFAEPVPEGANSHFEKLTAVRDYDVTGNSYSYPTGYAAGLAGGFISGVAGEGWFNQLMVLSGQGHARFRFSLGPLVDLSVNSTSLLEFKESFTISIVKNPPPTVPLRTRFSQLPSFGASPFQVQMRYPDGPSTLISVGMTTARFSVAERQGNSLSVGQVMAVSRKALKDNVCVWVWGVELSGRCSDLVQVPSSNGLLATFKPKKLQWTKATGDFDSIKLIASDISLAPMWQAQAKADVPANFDNMSAEDKMGSCIASVSSSRSYQLTSEIKPEMKASKCDIVLEPPSLVVLGETFLVRTKLLATSGGPVYAQSLRVTIIPVTTINKESISLSQLQNIGQMGNTIRSFGDQKRAAELEEETTVQESNQMGMVSFPLSIRRGQSGAYVLKFQLEEPGSSIIQTSKPFTVVNPIVNVFAGQAPWVDMEVETFEAPTAFTKKLRLGFVVSNNMSFEELRQIGMEIDLTLMLKGASKKMLEVKNKLTDAAEKKAQEGVQAASQAVGEVVDQAADAFVALTPQYMQRCVQAGMAGLSSASSQAPFRPASTTDAVGADGDVIDPTSMAGQFVRTVTGAGSEMVTASMMTGKLTTNVGLGGLQLISGQKYANGSFVGIYEVIQPIFFDFTKDQEYIWEASVNGKEASKDAFEPFTVVEKKISTTSLFFSWFVSFVALFVAAVVLTTNTEGHHWSWFIIAMLCTLGILIATPFEQKGQNSLGGHWVIFAIVNLSLILISLAWGLAVEKAPGKLRAGPERGETFAAKRERTFAQYSSKRLLELVLSVPSGGRKGIPPPTYPTDLSMKDQVKAAFMPFSSKTAFYFPSKVWVGMVLALFTYGYMLVETIKFQRKIDAMLSGLLQKATEQILATGMIIESAFSQVSLGQDLADDALAPLLKQVDMVRGWFDSLSTSMTIGVGVGCGLASVIVLLLLLMSLMNFRYRVLEARRGKYTFRKKDALPAFDSMFMGQFIASTIVGFIIIVLISTLVCMFIAWSIPRDIVWHYKWQILGTLVLPALVQPIIMIILKKILYGSDFIRLRPASSIFIFWQTFLTIPAGLMAGIIRFGTAVGCLLFTMPQIFTPATPEFLNKLALLDAAHKPFLAAVFMQHTHNHPIMITAARELLRRLAKRRELEKQGMAKGAIQTKAQMRSKCWIILLLVRIPALKQYRKSVIIAQREAAKAKKAKKAKDKDGVMDEAALQDFHGVGLQIAM